MTATQNQDALFIFVKMVRRRDTRDTQKYQMSTTPPPVIPCFEGVKYRLTNKWCA